jgi:hypothetical protein
MAKTGEGAGKTNYPQRDVASDPIVELIDDAGDLSFTQPLGAVMLRHHNVLAAKDSEGRWQDGEEEEREEALCQEGRQKGPS